MRQRQWVSALAIPLVLAFTAASCGSDDSSSDETTASEGSESTTDDTTGDEQSEATTPVTDDTVETTDAAETDTAVYGGTLTMGLEAEANGFRPWEDGCAEPCVNMARTFFDVLVQQNVDGVYEGYLA